MVYFLFPWYCVLKNSEWYSLSIAYLSPISPIFSTSYLSSVIFFREKVQIYLVSPYTEAPHYPCCPSLLLFISSETWKWATLKFHILFKMQVQCEFEWWHNHVSCWLPYSFPSSFYHLTLLFWSQWSAMVFWAWAEITLWLLPVIVSANLEIFAVNVYLGLFSPKTSNGFNQHWISFLLFYCPVTSVRLLFHSWIPIWLCWIFFSHHRFCHLTFHLFSQGTNRHAEQHRISVWCLWYLPSTNVLSIK